ncbi:MAG: hypothetical protein NC311_15475, partial [Muribaculaceae bacterium]|nr:hypothetical protein [Muribaculaceae bacterium]
EGASASRGYYLSNILSISAGAGHVLAIRSDGAVYGWGDNRYGQLGVGKNLNNALDDVLELTWNEAAALGATFTYRVPVQVLAGNDLHHEDVPTEMEGLMGNAMVVAAGGDHSLVLMSDGTVLAFGKDDYGQLGTYDGGASGLGSDVGWVSYDTSKNHAATSNSDEVTAWTQVEKYLKESRTAKPTLVQVSQGRTETTTADTGVVYMAPNHYDDINAEGQVAGTVYVVTPLNNVRAIAAGGNSSSAIVKDGDGATGGTVYAWGDNMYGQLGYNEIDEEAIFGVRTGFVGFAMPVHKGESNVQGSDNFATAMVISVGLRHMGAVRTDGYVWDWGKNDKGQLGNGTTTDSFWAVQAGDGESKTLLLQKYWKYDKNDTLLHEYSQLKPMGLDNPNSVTLADGEYLMIDLKEILYSRKMGFNLITDGESKSIADELHLVVADVADPSVLTATRGVGGDTTLVKLGATSDKLGLTSLYLDYENKAENTSNMLNLPVWVRHRQMDSAEGGDDDDAHVLSLAAPMVAAGAHHTVALDSLGRVWVWGDNTYGQLARDPSNTGTRRLDSPTRVTNFFTYSASGVTNTPYQTADGNPLTFVAVAAGDNFSMALDIEGHVWAWGQNAGGQLGRGNINAAANPNYVPMQVRARVERRSPVILLGDYMVDKEYIHKEGDIEYYDPYTEQDRIVAIAAGSNHALALAESGQVYAWGSNTFTQGNTITTTLCGQLGQGPLGETQLTTAKLVLKGKTSSTTTNLQGAVGIAAGGDTSAVLFPNGTVFTFGSNAYGQLGDGSSRSNRNSAIRVSLGEGDGLINVNDQANKSFMDKAIALEMGSRHGAVMALNITNIEAEEGATPFTVSPGVYGWGDNSNNQLGEPASSEAGKKTTFNYPVLMEPAGAQALAAGFNGTMAKVENQALKLDTKKDAVQLKAWGDNRSGQLGNKGAASGEPVNYDNTVARDLDGLQVDDVDYMQRISTFAMGEDFMVMSRDTGTVFAAGANGRSQLGDYGNTASNYPVVVGELSYASLLAWGTDHNTTPHDLSPQITLQGGEQVTFILDRMGYVEEKGYNLLAHKPAPVINVNDLEFTSLDESIISFQGKNTANNTVMFGSPDALNPKMGNTFIQIYERATGRSLLLRVQVLPTAASGRFTTPKLAAGKEHTVAVKADGTAWAWGSNQKGQLGDGTFTNRAYPVQMRDMNGKMFTNVISAAAGDGFSALLVDTDGNMLTTNDRQVYVVGTLTNVTTNLGEKTSYEEQMQAWLRTQPLVRFLYRRGGEYAEFSQEQIDAGMTSGWTYSGILTRVTEQRTDEDGNTYTYYFSYSKYRDEYDRDCGKWSDIPEVCPNPKHTHSGEYMVRDGQVNSDNRLVVISATVDVDRIHYDAAANVYLYTYWDDAAGKYQMIFYTETYKDPTTNMTYFVSDTFQSHYNHLGTIKNTAGAVDKYVKAHLPEMLMLPVGSLTADFYTISYMPVTYTYYTGTLSCKYSWVEDDGTAAGKAKTCGLKNYDPSASKDIPLVCDDPTCELLGQQYFTKIYDDKTNVWAGRSSIEFVNLPASEQRYRVWQCANDHVWIDYYSDVEREMAVSPVVQLVTGAGTAERVGVTNVVEITAGADHLLALTKDGKVYAAGNNAHGELGQGNTEPTEVAVEVKGFKGRSLLNHVVELAAGDGFTVALRANGEMYAWGRNDKGQLGNELTALVSAGSAVNYATTPVQINSGEYRVDEKPEFRNITGVYGVTAGRDHVMVVARDNLWVPDVSTDEEQVTKATSGGHYDRLTTLFGWGSNAKGQLGLADTSKIYALPANVGRVNGITTLSGGGDHTLLRVMRTVDGVTQTRVMGFGDSALG